MAKKKSAKKATSERAVKKAAAKAPVAPAEKRPIDSYTHGDKRRANNPPVGLVTPQNDPTDPPKKTYAFDPHLDPQLVWAGKAERTSFEVPSISLHVHERIDPKSIIAAVRSNGHGASHAPAKPRQKSLFEEPEENPPLRDALDFYKHPHGWTNRLVAGDSLLVMNSLLEKEGLAGKVQMVYIDPPYGIRYGSNFQPFVSRRDVKDGNDADLTQEPEMIKAFRDTWELGIHSYLTSLRDRLILAKELLSESGSIFVQIGEENIHRVRLLLDEIFHPENSIATIAYKSAVGLGAKHLDTVATYILWFCRDVNTVKSHHLYQRLTIGEAGATRYLLAENDKGEVRRLSAEEVDNPQTIPAMWKPFFKQGLTSRSGGESTQFAVEFEGKHYRPTAGGWRTNEDGMAKAINANRITIEGNRLAYKRFFDDFAATPINNIWDDISGGIKSRSDPKVYAVQTSTSVIQRCMLMTTDPGDLVLDITCGSGTTAFVAETWGRRWITCDTSRVAVTLAKQRLLTAVFDYYELASPRDGVGGGFRYKTVPHVTLKSIANNPEIREGMTREQIDAAIAKYAEQETLFDQPFLDRTKARVTGPFTVEAVPALNVRPIEMVEESRPFEADAQKSLPGFGPTDGQQRLELTATTSVARYGETLRQRNWRDELQASGVRAKGGQRIEFTRLEPLPACRWLHAVGETRDRPPKRVVVSFGPEHAPLEQRQVEQALDEALTLRPKPDIVLFAAFHFDPEAAKDIEALTPEKTGVVLLKLQMNTDLLTDDLK